MSLDIDQVHIRYSDGTTLGPYTLQATTGLTHLTGPNGSGKSTLLRAIAGELPPARGTLRIQGQCPYTHPEARRHLGYVAAKPELPAHFTVHEAWTTLASIRRTPSWDGDAMRRALDLPADLRLGHASAGQLRRTALLLGCVGDPEILLLDEVFAHLDVAAAALLAEWIEAWRATRTLLLVHHGDPPVTVDRHIALPTG